MKVYLDNNATTPLHPEVKKEIIEFVDIFGNPSSMHEFGRTAKEKFDKARRNISAFIGAPREDLIFTSCGSESNNTVLKSIFFQDYDFTPHIITSNIEHPCIKETSEFLRKKGIDVTFVPVDGNGIIQVDKLRKSIRKETVLISVMYANNEIGSIQPIEEIGKIAQENNIKFHTDATQAAGKIKFRIQDLPVDFASFSGHKIYAPKGIGILYVRNFKKNKKWLTSLIHGGHQEQHFRAGTENTIGIIALGKACEMLEKEIDVDIIRIKDLRDHFESELVKRIPDVVINAEDADRLVGTSNVTFKFIEGESILLRLDMNGIAVSTGSACSTGSLEPSHVLMAISDDPEMAHGSIRFSIGRENTKEEIDYTLEVLEKEIAFLRKISPLRN